MLSNFPIYLETQCFQYKFPQATGACKVCNYYLLTVMGHNFYIIQHLVNKPIFRLRPIWQMPVVTQMMRIMVLT